MPVCVRWNKTDFGTNHILYANQGGENVGSFTDKRLQAFAESLGLDMSVFNKCFSANKYSAEIETDYQNGQSLGVDSTPTVLVNGIEFSPAYVPTYEQLKTAIDTALAWEDKGVAEQQESDVIRLSVYYGYITQLFS
jgi:protein-disulfide isomerase